jgi:peptidoglycan/LPS O-acetylase OafA/YrhL
MDKVDLITLFVWLSALQPAGLLLAAGTQGLPMALGLILVTAAIYGQVVVNDAMVGRYVPDEYRNRVYSIRFFLSFSVAGFAVPVIGILHENGGFPRVLLISGAIGALILACALAAWVMTRGKLTSRPLPAE